VLFSVNDEVASVSSNGTVVNGGIRRRAGNVTSPAGNDKLGFCKVQGRSVTKWFHNEPSWIRRRNRGAD